MSEAFSQRDDYWDAVNDVAERVFLEVSESDEEDRDESVVQLISENCDQHEYVIHNELQIHTLLYSRNACAGFFDGTFAANQYGRSDDFPFADLAADAFVADVTNKVRQFLDDQER